MAELRVAGEKSDIGGLLEVLAFDAALSFACHCVSNLKKTHYFAVRQFLYNDLAVDWGWGCVVRTANKFVFSVVLLENSVLAIDTEFHLDFQFKIVGNFPR
jgi:hypothetical protein